VNTVRVASSPVEAATIRKLRVRLLPFLFILFAIAFIDRTNLGFAALTMNRELAITSQQFGFAAGIFSWATSCLRFQATSSCTRSALVSGSPES
jgi:sugar phosphate permease